MTIVLITIAIAALALLAYVFCFGELAQRHRGSQSFALPVQSDATGLDRAIEPLTAAHGGLTGLHMLASNDDAFKTRLHLARRAGRSLDLQYYYWKGDLTGRLLCLEVIAAADRGVRVRLLLDDINSAGLDSTYIALDSHANIEVRLFNPSRSRSNSLRRGLELMLKYFTATRRMHNKCWIADGRMAVIGGRNIGDAYFDASDGANFRDIDLLTAGRAVSDAEAIFDRYWNSPSALPIRSLHRIRRPKLPKLAQRLNAFAAADKARSFMAMADRAGSHLPVEAAQFHWIENAKVIADPPEKAFGRSQEFWLGRELEQLIRSARSDLRIISPYFIPGDAGAGLLHRLELAGVDVRVLTNSLAATDVMAVHGAYARYRSKLIAYGVKLYELKPEDAQRKASLFGSSTASLHTKALVVDNAVGFVGSFNLDPRSMSINTEMGVLFESPELADELHRIFARQTRPETSYRVETKGGQLQWSDRHNGTQRHFSVEPNSPLRRRLAATLIGWLPVESQL